MYILLLPAQLYHDVIICCMLHRSAEPSHQPAVAVPPTNKPSMEHTDALSLSECSSLSSFIAQDQVIHGYMSLWPLLPLSMLVFSCMFTIKGQKTSTWFRNKNFYTLGQEYWCAILSLYRLSWHNWWYRDNDISYITTYMNMD